MHAIPVSTETVPPKTIPAPRSHVAIPTPRAAPAIAPRYENWFPRRNTRPIPSTPCSSVIHASQAPLMQVPPIPRSDHGEHDHPVDGDQAEDDHDSPARIIPMMIESRRL